jgi:hypothetical protein
LNRIGQQAGELFGPKLLKTFLNELMFIINLFPGAVNTSPAERSEFVTTDRRNDPFMS